MHPLLNNYNAQCYIFMSSKQVGFCRDTGAKNAAPYTAGESNVVNVLLISTVRLDLIGSRVQVLHLVLLP